MVTMPPEVGRDYALVRDLLKRGMDCMRINSAHDPSTLYRLTAAASPRRAMNRLGGGWHRAAMANTRSTGIHWQWHNVEKDFDLL